MNLETLIKDHLQFFIAFCSLLVIVVGWSINVIVNMLRDKKDSATQLLSDLAVRNENMLQLIEETIGTIRVELATAKGELVTAAECGARHTEIREAIDRIEHRQKRYQASMISLGELMAQAIKMLCTAQGVECTEIDKLLEAMRDNKINGLGDSNVN